MGRLRSKCCINVPEATNDFLHAISVETARMSYPASMTRGKNPPLVGSGNVTVKKRIESYFRRLFPINDIWTSRISDYDRWHEEQTTKMGNFLRRHNLIGPGRCSSGIAAKFLNTYMHQLMKYEQARYLYEDIHLPLDQKIFTRLSRVRANSLEQIEQRLKQSPYTFNYPAYMEVQIALKHLVDELNHRANAEFVFNSRVELNWLWAQE